MRAVGVIVEYNPFHNGHAFHLQQAKEKSGADICIAVMSGNFLQRGEPALVSKWSRTEMALLAGVDLVFELPYRFATQKAEIFADGAISILAAANAEAVCFGSEDGDITSFQETIAFLDEHKELYQAKIKQQMKAGVSYPQAASNAFLDLAPANTMIDLSKPNNILGFQYMKSIHQQNASIRPLTIERKSAGYHDEDFSSATIASATSIRKALFSENKESHSIHQYVPETTYTLLNHYLQMNETLHHWENYWPYLQYKIISSSTAQLKEIYEVEEGIEFLLKKAALHSASFEQFMNQIKSKRYTWTRLQRICVHILTNTTKQEMQFSKTTASYLRLLGMTTKGREYLNKTKKQLHLPLVSKLSSFRHDEIDLDIKAAQIYALGLPVIRQTTFMKQEYAQSPILI